MKNFLEIIAPHPLLVNPAALNAVQAYNSWTDAKPNADIHSVTKCKSETENWGPSP